MSTKTSQLLRVVMTTIGLVAVCWSARAFEGLAATAETVLAAQERPVFEVVSVRHNTSGDANSSSGQLPGGGFSARNQTVQQLILEAYRIQAGQLRGNPGWTESERYDIEARPAAAASSAESQQMLQNLLADRFALKVHFEGREVDGYALVVAPSGSRLKLNTEKECKPPCGGTMNSPTGKLTSRKVPVGRFAVRLAEVVSRPVVDKTGLQGEYDMQLDWAPEPSQFGGAAKEIPNDSRPSLFTAIEEQLGLRLVNTKVTVQTLVVDSIDRPSSN